MGKGPWRWIITMEFGMFFFLGMDGGIIHHIAQIGGSA